MYKAITAAQPTAVLGWIQHNEISEYQVNPVVKDNAWVADEYSFADPDDAIYFSLRWC